MQKICANSWCQQSFKVTDDDLAFYEKVSPVFNGKKEMIPPPTQCPECRSRRRMMWRNERSLKTRECEMCHKKKVSMFSPTNSIHTYCHECWWSNAWDPLSYGREYNFNIDFQQNLEGIVKDVPLVTLFQAGVNENCEFTNYFGPDSRNCYMIYNSGRDEDCSFSRGLIESKSCMDILIGNQNQFCYECVNVSECYKAFFSQNITQCTESAFLFNCRRCTHCFGCTNLVQKEYYVWNKPCTPSEYNSIMAKLRSAVFVDEMKRTFENMKLSCIHRENQNINTENCTGDYLISSKNCDHCYEAKGSEDCKRMLCSKLTKDSHDLFGFGYDSELLYDCVGVGLSMRVAFSWVCTSVSDSLYCMMCNNLKHCFGCVSLRHKQYCIFNKQYTKEEYEQLVPRIIHKMSETGEYGEFLPRELCPFTYNETVAQEFLPLTKESALQKGFRWIEDPPHRPIATKTIPASAVPDTVDDIPDDVLHWAIVCEATKKPFKITKQELDFYREMHLPIPRIHPDERHVRRMRLRNPCKLWNRKCANCQRSIATSYSPDRPEIVYCESCYRTTVY